MLTIQEDYNDDVNYGLCCKSWSKNANMCSAGGVPGQVCKPLDKIDVGHQKANLTSV